ncbi:hypothetical protein G5714_004663 [Onychostoma macrolepis]|uniref:DDE Tnp4 domain-containing protein n=1 Tax=Onychostoma macrolepis TaxID=369639 RepID=A0A7J6D5A5_9TELE|nr:hypothetical protein G5714_004663 [Onychostoma macrolepis]
MVRITSAKTASASISTVHHPTTSEVFSTYKSHTTFKAMIGMAPHGAVTFVSGLYAGSMSDHEIFKQSGIVKLLKPGMAIMVDKGFVVDNLAPCKVYRPAFLCNKRQMSREDVRQTQSIARLRVHVESEREQTVRQGHTTVYMWEH